MHIPFPTAKVFSKQCSEPGAQACSKALLAAGVIKMRFMLLPTCQSFLLVFFLSMGVAAAAAVEEIFAWAG